VISVDPIPSAVKDFLYANVDAVDQLEILRLTAADPQKEHSCLSLAHALQVPLETAEQHIRTLAGRGMLTITVSQPLACRAGAASEELEDQVQQLVKTYVERPVTLIKMVYEKPKEQQLRSFADAFRLKKEK
jgi:predicted ArsR family transcriptional regulator